MSYTRVNWKNGIEGATPISADNLNIMDGGIKTLDTQLNTLSGTVSTNTTDITTAQGKITTIESNINTINTNKADKTEIPTKTSDITNDSDYRNGTQVQTAINDAISGITGFDYKVVQTLPTSGEKGVIYLVPKTGSGNDVYDEYIWLSESSKFEYLGTTQVDLTNYYTKDETYSKSEVYSKTEAYSKTEVYSKNESDDLLDDKQDTLVSGTNIKTINGNNIVGSGNIEIQTGGSPEVYIQDEEPTEDDWKIWVDTGELSNLGSEVVDTLSGNETNKAPSVRAVNETNSYSTEEKVVGTWVDGKPLYQKTYKVKSPNATGTGTNILDLTSLNYEFIRIINADFFYESFYGPANYFVNSTDYAALWIRPFNKNVACIVAQDGRKNQDIYITLEYTKTTD